MIASSPLADRAAILLVDDHPENLLALEAVLEPLGQRLIRAASGQEALRAVLREDLALILMDVEMPGMDGFETATQIKRRERSRQIPIIFLTAARPEQPEAFRGYEVGAVDYLPKPFAPAVLRSKVQVFVELHEARREAELMARRAAHDPLTGLPNRVVFMDRLAATLAGMQRRPIRMAVLFFDLDGFKLVNDTLGHEAGDQLLQQVAERLLGLLRPSDAVARFGGDEFTVLAEVDEERDVEVIAERIAAVIAAPFRLDAGDAFVSTSIGIALACEPGQDPETLVREADAAMYRAKHRGGARHEIFDGEMRRRALERITTESALRKALDHGELQLVYRPEVELATGSMVAIQALLHWDHPEQGLLRPPEFLSGTEHSQLMRQIASWALGAALGELERWNALLAGASPVTLAFEVPARQLGGRDSVPWLLGMLAARGADPNRLRLDISDSAVLDQRRFRTASLDELRTHGIGLALNDFGVGCPSLARLRDLPLEAVKLDASLIQSEVSGDGRPSLLAAMVDLAHALELRTVVMGVETAEQAQRISALGADRAHGTFYATPLSGPALAELLEAGAGSLPAPPLVEEWRRKAA
jgi:diguanylate cyclase (GGDEF)-like protein